MTISIVDYELPNETHNLYNVTFFEDEIHTLVTRNPFKVDMWISETLCSHSHRRRRVIVGLAVKWSPSSNHNNQNRISIIQLCVGRRCLIFQIIRSPWNPASLHRFLLNANHTFVGVGIAGDVEKLSDYYYFEVPSALDLRGWVARELGMRELVNAGLEDLERVVLGKEVEKPRSVDLIRWDEARLTHDQVKFACVDVFLSF